MLLLVLVLVCYFNSIKVRLKPDVDHLFCPSLLIFQFHKGTIKTDQPARGGEEYQLFQFHKGTIKTNTKKEYPLTEYPHFNSIKVRLKHKYIVGGIISAAFQFHKGTIKTQQPVVSDLQGRSFQFHKGTIKTLVCSRLALSMIISIP